MAAAWKAAGLSYAPLCSNRPGAAAVNSTWQLQPLHRGRIARRSPIPQGRTAHRCWAQGRERAQVLQVGGEFTMDGSVGFRALEANDGQNGKQGDVKELNDAAIAAQVAAKAEASA